ncbi:4-hydroxy-tetrahydrodipicolinate reductase [Mogibacterium timidum]|uniref:4-hydroxy-tetrahydrodipicolinate reductase n=1 Tax=Mogibacterium timidum TaxID=35519 RepID=UPI002352F8C7|nr:4-hydroxy-tetrahydrodipicolinate reductase [Mogibacterium timidum]
MKLLVVGPRGKMGRLITGIAAEREDITLVGGVAPSGRDYIGTDLGEVAMIGRSLGVPVVSDVEELIDKCDVIIDFATVEQAMVTLEAAVRHKKALICGTTGFNAEQRSTFEEAGKVIPVMLAANTSRLVNVMYKLIEDATKLAGDVDIEILDMHDNTKLDSPSGTAKEIGEIVAAAREKALHDVDRYGREGRCPRRHGEIAFHSIRGGDISSSHTTYFVGPGERLEITHHSQSFKCFAAGAVDCAVFLGKQSVGSYTVQDCFGL